MPHIVYKSGLWAAMKPAEKAVYGVLCYHANFNTGTCFPSIETISIEAGVNKNCVCAALRQLCVYGLIEKMRGPKSNIYTIIYSPEIDPSTFPKEKKGEHKYRPRDVSGKFSALPQNMETTPLPQKVESGIPQNMESGIPQNMERKESNIKEKKRKRNTEFESFWSIYPRKREKEDAFITWKTLNKTQQAEILLAAPNYKKEVELLKTEERYIKHAKTFLNPKKKRWKDFLPGTWAPPHQGDPSKRPVDWDAWEKD